MFRSFTKVYSQIGWGRQSDKQNKNVVAVERVLKQHFEQDMTL